MILSNLNHSDRYKSLHPAFEEIFNTIKNTDWSTTEFGKIELDSDKVFIIYSEVETIARETQILEYHQAYLDIHIVLKGKEIIGHKHLEDCQKEKQAYDSEKDFGLYTDLPTNYFTLSPNDFAIIYPEDAHAPIIGNGEKIHKLVVKVKL